MSLWADLRKKSLGQEVRTEDYSSLTKSQESLLQTIEDLPSPFDDISSLKELMVRTGVSVVVTDRTELVNVLDDCIKRINDYIIAYRNRPDRRVIEEQIERDIYDRCRWAEEQLKKPTLLGLYSRKLLWFDNVSSPTIYLFADNINDYAASIGKSADNVFGYVFIHEMMHAYYDSFNSDGFPSWERLEEPFAEFGMLTFIKNSTLPPDLLEDATAHVQAKIVHGPREYGFGLEIFKRTGGEAPDMIRRYRDISNWIDAKIIRSRQPGSDYFYRDMPDYMKGPSDTKAKKCFDGVKKILAYDWPKPTFTIQPSIPGSRSTSPLPSGYRPSPSRALPKLRVSEQWAMTGIQTGSDYQCPLVHKDDLMDLLAEVVKVIKKKGFESYLSIVGNDLLFLGKPFSRHASAPAKSLVIPESLCVGGTTIFPAFVSPVYGPAVQVGRILHALSILFDGLFTLVHENAGFTLFGPGTCLPLFSARLAVTPVPSGTGRVKKYEIIDKTTSTVIRTEKDMAKTVLFIVHDYCSKNSGITLADLQSIFASVPNYSLPGKSIIESAVNVSAYMMSHPGDRHDRYFIHDPITLTTGDIIMVSKDWANNGEKANFGDFKSVVDGLGYIIKMLY